MRTMQPISRLGLFGLAAIALASGCAIQTSPVKPVESTATFEGQHTAQQAVVTAAPVQPQLKRKIALGRVTNETAYGQSLLRDRSGDPLGKQVGDLLSKGLTESGAFLVFERPDIGKVEAEGQLSGAKLNLIGADVLIIGSLTEFGRKTIGESGFASNTKRQVAFAKIDLRVVDVATGQVIFATSGAGQASNETSSTFGFGSTASYDGTLNDAAIRQAVSDAVSKIAANLSSRPWQTAVLKTEPGRVYLGGGKAQGLKPGMKLTIQTAGEQIKSPQTGALIRLPGKTVATVRVEALFGDTELTEGAVATIVSGSLTGLKAEQLVVRTAEGAQ